MICLCLSGNTLERWGQELQRNRQWISVVELRVDLLKPGQRNPDAIRAWWKTQTPRLPAILTIRRARDLGKWEGDEAQRAFLFEELLDAVHPEYVDLELDRRGEPTWDRIALQVRAGGGTVLRSHHEIRETPSELSQLMVRLAGEPREIPKLAVHIRSASDLAALIRTADEFSALMAGRPALWVGIGEHGMLTRAFPARTRSKWTYAVDREEAAVAPGQFDARTLHELYRVGDAGAQWPLFAVVGAPVAHSRSPEYHNKRFSADGIHALYIPLRVDRFTDFRELADLLPLQGVSVTVPHKEAAWKIGIEQEGGRAARVRAANTLVRTADGSWRADNTDVAGFLAPLREMEIAAGLRAAVVGAGGAARAVVAGLREIEAEVYLFNRTVSRAEALAGDMELPADRVHGIPALGRWSGEPFDLIVQTTNVGMQGPGDPVPDYRFRGSEIAYDIVYTRPETAFLARARSAGCRTINGETMFEHQAAEQYRLFVASIGDVGEASR